MREIVWVYLCGAVLTALLFALRLKGSGLRAWTALLALPLSAVLGALLAKLCYALLMLDVLTVGLDAFTNWNFDRLSFFGGGLGVCLGVAAATKICRVRPAEALDAFAPAGAVMVCAARAGEIFLGTLGVGSLLPEDSPFCRFPFAVMMENSWEEQEWWWAVFLLEAAVALIIALIYLFRRPGPRAGETFRKTLFLLAAAQIICESLRARCMKWGFVRVEQVLCAVLILGLVCLSCWRLRRTIRKAACILCPVTILVGFGIIGFMEYALDKISALPNPVCYGIMVLCLAGMTALAWRVFREERRLPEAQCRS